MTDNTLRNPKSNRMAFTLGVLGLICSFFLPQTSFAQDDPAYEEISVFMNVPGIGTSELQAVIKDDTAYLAITDIFDFLKIKNTPSVGLDSISGFLLTQQDIFLIDKLNRQINYQKKVINLNPNDLIRTATNLYLRSDYFDRIFGLKCTFNFRSLSVTLTTKLELPIAREKRQETMRTNINHLNGEIKADTILRRSHPILRLGMADWSASVTNYLPGNNSTQLNLVLGTAIAGGDANLSINYNNTSTFLLKDQFYQWRTVNNDRSYLRQVTAGKIAASTTSSIYSPVIGAQFTNTSTTNRRSFGSYTLSNHTDPGWTVELYVNNELINFVKADASGFYSFNVPMVYGNTIVKLRFYGPWGEERTSEQNMVIPFNLLPLHQFEYTASAGIVQDTVNSRFSRVDLHYGVSKRLTLGGGLEYLSSITTGDKIPFLNASLRLTSNLLINTEYDYNVQTKVLLSYHLPSNLQVDFNYINYKKGQTAINNFYLEERKAIISLPMRGKNYSAFTRFTLYQAIMPTSKYTTAEGLISGMAFGLNTNITTYAMFTQTADPYIYSNISTVLKLPKRISFTPELQYEYNTSRIVSVKGEFGKYLSTRSYMNLTYENNFKSSFQSIGVEFHYDFSFAAFGFSARHINNTNTIFESARGSLLYDASSNHMGFSKSSSVGRGGLVILPYLDLNNNGKRDKGEPRVAGLTVQINGGTIQYNKKDTIVRISNLEAYTNYIIKLLPSFNNIALLIKKPTISIGLTPNQFKLLEIPVSVINEVSGTVNIKTKGSEKGQGRITVCFYNSEFERIGSVLTESDGFFNYSALPPGSYIASIDSAQLLNLNLESLPYLLHFNIVPNKDGDIVDGLKFTLAPSGSIPPFIPRIIPQVIPELIPQELPQLIPQVHSRIITQIYSQVTLQVAPPIIPQVIPIEMQQILPEIIQEVNPSVKPKVISPVSLQVITKVIPQVVPPILPKSIPPISNRIIQTLKAVDVNKKTDSIPQNKQIPKSENNPLKKIKIADYKNWLKRSGDSLFNKGYLNWLKQIKNNH